MENLEQYVPYFTAYILKKDFGQLFLHVFAL